MKDTPDDIMKREIDGLTPLPRPTRRPMEMPGLPVLLVFVWFVLVLVLFA